MPALTRGAGASWRVRKRARRRRRSRPGSRSGWLWTGKPSSCQPEAVLVESSSPAGYAVAEDNGVLVALDTTMTPELRAEGLARELVRNIQDARKTAGLAIADRIAVTLEGADEALAEVLERWGATIRSETLADTLVLGVAEAGAHVVPLELDGLHLTLALQKVS